MTPEQWQTGTDEMGNRNSILPGSGRPSGFGRKPSGKDEAEVAHFEPADNEFADDQLFEEPAAKKSAADKPVKPAKKSPRMKKAISSESSIG